MNNVKIMELSFFIRIRIIRDEADLENRKKEVYLKIPEIQNIESEISKVGLTLAKAVLQDPRSREKIVNESKQRMNELKNRKDELLSRHGIPTNYLEIKYNCNNCRDTGFLSNGEKCSCFKQEIINEAYKMSR